VGEALIIVRDARADEHAIVRELTLGAYAQYATIMTLTAWAPLERAVHLALASTETVHRIVAELGGTIVGSVQLYPAAADAYEGVTHRVHWPVMRLLAVAPEARGLGVGRVLVDECVRRARADGAREIGLHTSASMRAAMRLYERMGFARIPEFDFQPEGAELVEAYRLPLDSKALSS
jgi:ribosomal protein S18 acetylase RimI-like enzyme